MDTDERFTDGRVPHSKIKELFSDEHRWQRFLDVEAALAAAEAEVGIVPHDAAKAIADWANVEKLNADRIRIGIRKTSHPLMALISELSNAVGEPHGGFVHWGATTQNITQTGDALVLREVHHVFLDLLGKVFASMGSLAEKTQDMVCAGRTHGQQAVPITFGLKVATWIDEFERHVDRLQSVEPRIFTAMLGGAVGSFASLGEKGPIVQTRMAELLGLTSMKVPSRAMSDSQAEYVAILGLIAGTTSKIAREVALLMETEFGEVSEPIPVGTIGSSTMPHKRNPQLADDCIAISAEIRSLVSLALEGMLHDHEVSAANSQMTDNALRRACILIGDLLPRLIVILSGLTLNSEKMRANLDLTGGLIASEAVMLALGKDIGRQSAHEVVYEAAQEASLGKKTFKDILTADPRVTAHLGQLAISRLLDPKTKIGLSTQMSQDAVLRAHEQASKLQKTHD